MSAPYSLGRIGLNIRGEYSADATYAHLDVVYHNGSSYVAKADNTKALPIDKEYWQLLAKGEAEEVVHSTEETLTNQRWIDGKPIYRKTYFKPELLKSTAATNFVLGTIPANVEQIINLTGFCFHNGYEWVPVNWYYNDLHMCGCYFNSSNLRFRTGSYTDSGWRNISVTIEYTKTTD